MIRFLSSVLGLVAIAFILSLLGSDAEGCAAIGRPQDSIRISQEGAVIVWDSVKKIEHFIRRASFDTKSPDFGFLVPTPTKPVLAEVKDKIFRDMETWILPRTVTKTRYVYEPLILSHFMMGTSAPAALHEMQDAPKSAVRVLGEQKVGGFQTAILEADNSEALAAWLKENGYASNPELQSWLAPYVGAKWKITAFKIIQDPKTGQLATTEPVRMSFQTDRPFFPYREPAHKDEKEAKSFGRLLRVFFVSNERMDGKLGNDLPWQASVPWSDSLTDEQRKTVATETGVPEAEVPAKAWMTTFEDFASPRPGNDEVYFDPAKTQSPTRPPDHLVYRDRWVPIDVVVVILVVVGVVIFVVRRLRK